MQPLGKALKTATIEGRPWRQELSRFLFTYRNTPHSTTGVQNFPFWKERMLWIDTKKHVQENTPGRNTTNSIQTKEEIQGRVKLR